MKRSEDPDKVYWKDIKQYRALFDLTYRAMLKKFYPHFRGYEDDLQQELMIELISSIKRIKKGEIRSVRNYIITALKYKAFKIARKVIDYDRSTLYLEDLIHGSNQEEMSNNFSNQFEWDFYLQSPGGIVSVENILSCFTTKEEQYMIFILMRRKGYSRTSFKKEFKIPWDDILKLEVDTRDKLIEILKMYTGE